MTEPQAYVLTSKGPRRRSQVHHVQGGTHVRRADSGWQLRPRENALWQSVAHLAQPQAEVEAQGGWQSWADWRNTTGASVTSFVASWVVPPEPSIPNGQLIYLFNGLMDAGNSHILQPVLQWGASPAQGSGNAWGLASFWVGGETDPMFCTDWIGVAPGTMVTGRMTVAMQSNGLFSCTCQFDNYPGTQLTAENLPALVDCSLALEAYNVGPDAPYPGVPGTDFVSVALATGAVTPPVSWTSNGGAVITIGGGNGGSVEVVYPRVGGNQ